MYSFSEGEIHFNLMAIVGDRRKRFQNEIDRLESQQDTAAKMVCIKLTSIQILSNTRRCIKLDMILKIKGSVL